MAITKDGFLKQQSEFYEDHARHHSPNAFCGSAGAEEMKHIEELVESLSDDQIKELVRRGGIGFKQEDETEFDRDVYEGVIDEIDREDFYRIYRELTT